jgi:uncharacterized coiled-coil protein SlyX
VATGDTAEGLVERQLASLHAALAERDAIIAAQAVQLTARAEQLAAQGAQLTKLNEQLDELKKQLGRSSSNSNLPPSSDGPGAGPRGGIPTKPRVKSGRKRGGQKGRRGCHRASLESDQVDEFVDLFPEACERCPHSLPKEHDAAACRFQQLELRDHRPHVTEWRRHEVRCPRCRAWTRAAYYPNTTVEGEWPARDAGAAHTPRSPGPVQTPPSTSPGPMHTPGTPSERDAGNPTPATPPAGQAASFFLFGDQPHNTTAPIVRSDARGATHVLYPLYGAGGAYYAFCPRGCEQARDIAPVLLTTEGSVTNAAIALTPDGRPRVLLSTLLRVYYGQCDQRCGESQSWTLSVIDEHQGARDVTGQALALDPMGRPRFIEHTYLAYLGVGQKPPATWYMQCDAVDCGQPESWQRDQISDKIWTTSQLKFSADGRAHLLTSVENADGNSAGLMLGAYFECAGACTTQAAWPGVGLTRLYESNIDDMYLSLSLALTKSGQPRLALIELTPDNGRRLLYFECDADCQADNWQGAALSDCKELGSGVDLALDARDFPRLVFTFDDAIGYYACEATSCTGEQVEWQLRKVELASDLPKDDIILWPNCTIDAWVLNTPSLALDADGTTFRVGYQAADLSGGVRIIDPTKPRCLAGKDMVWSRMSVIR